MNRSQLGADAHARFAKKADGVSVVYGRGLVTKSLTAWIGTNNFSRDQSTAIVPISSDRDYLLYTMDLGELGVPQRGDRITETINGVVCVYEATPTADGNPCWVYQGHSQAMTRIYTKRVS